MQFGLCKSWKVLENSFYCLYELCVQCRWTVYSRACRVKTGYGGCWNSTTARDHLTSRRSTPGTSFSRWIAETCSLLDDWSGIIRRRWHCDSGQSLLTTSCILSGTSVVCWLGRRTHLDGCDLTPGNRVVRQAIHTHVQGVYNSWKSCKSTGI